MRIRARLSTLPTTWREIVGRSRRRGRRCGERYSELADYACDEESIAVLTFRVDHGVRERHDRLAVVQHRVEAGVGTSGELGFQRGGHRVAVGGVAQDVLDGDPER